MSLDMLPKTEATIKTIIFELNKIQCIQDLLKKIMRNHNLTELLGDKGVNLFLKFYLYFFCVRIFKLYSFITFQLYNTVLFTIATMLYVKSSDLIHLLPESFCPLVIALNFLQTLGRGNHFSTLCFYKIDLKKKRFLI